MKALLGFALTAALGIAGQITNPNIIIEGTNGSQQASLPTNTFSANTGTYSLTTTFCFDAFCPGQSAPGAGPTFTVNDPLTVRITSTTITCLLTTACPSFTLDVFSDWTPVGVATGTVFAPVLTLDGTAPAGLNFSVEGIFGTTVCNPNCPTLDTGSLPVTTQNNGQFSLTQPLGTLSYDGSGIKAALFMTIKAGLGAGQSLTLPSSMTLTMATSGAPEPATIGLLVAGLGGLGLLLRKRR